MTTEFAVKQARTGDVVVVAVSGEVDLTTAPLMEKAASAAVLRTDVVRVVLDLEATSFIDSSGLGALVCIRALASDNDTQLQLRGLQPQVRRVLELGGLSSLFGVDAS